MFRELKKVEKFSGSCYPTKITEREEKLTIDQKSSFN